MDKIFDCLVIGSGPSGIKASIELHQNNIDVAILDGGTPGGKINIAPRVDNYPGYKMISGPDLAYVFYEKLLKEKIKLIPEYVETLTKEDNLFKIVTKYNSYYSKTVLIASGTIERKLGLAREDYFFARGISYCALCDGHFFKDKVAMVIGGGNAALKEALHLVDIVKHLYLIHRRNEFRGNMKLVNELKEHSNVTILTPYIPLEFLGDEKITGIKILNVETKEEKFIELDGIFPLVGQNPNSGFITIEGVKDEKGFVPVDKNLMTSCDGLFAAGDILPRDIRQIYLAEYDGYRAAKTILNYLRSNQRND